MRKKAENADTCARIVQYPIKTSTESFLRYHDDRYKHRAMWKVSLLLPERDSPDQKSALG